MFSCGYTGVEGKKKIRDQQEESLGGLLEEGPEGKILGKGRVRATQGPQRSPGRCSSLA